MNGLRMGLIGKETLFEGPYKMLKLTLLILWMKTHVDDKDYNFVSIDYKDRFR